MFAIEKQPVDQGGSRFLLQWKFPQGSSLANETTMGGSTDLVVQTDGPRRWAELRETADGRHLFLFGEVTSLGGDCQDRQRQLNRIAALAGRLPMGELARRLDGSFVLAILDNRECSLTVITDRLGSIPVFSTMRDGSLSLTSSLRSMLGSGIDPVGCAIYLRFGYQFSERTIFDGVRREPRASVITWRRGARSFQTYWSYTFDELLWRDRREGRRYLAQQWKEAVAARIPARGEIAISLSGGMDCRAVLGALLEVVDDHRRIRAFSYGEPNDPDVQAAARMARLLGLRHERFGFSGDITKTLLRNAHLNEGLVDFYTHGLDGLFLQRDRLTQSAVMLAGDTFQRGVHGFKDLDDIFRRGLELDPNGRAPEYLGLGEWSADELSSGIRYDIDRLKANLPRCTDADELHDYLYLDRRVAHMLMPWRHCHAGRFAPVANPLLDARILDFYRHAPQEWRHGKQVHLETLRTFFPRLGQLPFPRSGVNNQRVMRALRAEGARLRSLMIHESPSRLDALIPPVIVEAALDDWIHRIRAGGWIGVLMEKGRRRVLRNKVGRRLGRPVNLLPALGMRQLGRLLALRWFLRE